MIVSSNCNYVVILRVQIVYTYVNTAVAPDILGEEQVLVDGHVLRQKTFQVTQTYIVQNT